MPLPTADLPEWRYGRIDQLELDRWRPWMSAGSSPSPAVPPALAALVSSLAPSVVAVAVNGGIAAVHGADPAVTVETDLATLPDPGLVEPVDAFTLLNEAFAAPLVVRVAPASRPAGPIVVVHWTDEAADGATTFPRTRVEIGRAAEAGIVELAASADVVALTVPVTEIDVADGAQVEYLHLQRLGPQVWQLGRQASRVGRDAAFTSALIALGGDYARMRTDSAVVGTGGTARLLAAYFGAGSRTIDVRTTQDHRAAHSTSELLFKGAVANRSKAVYTGLIRVEKGARATNAFQTNRNLVLHDGARADSVPNLEIEDNDVRCSHASAVGPIAPDQRFYLESRGVPPEAADRLITLGFLDEVLARMPFAPLIDYVRLQLVADLDEADRAESAASGSGGAVVSGRSAGAGRGERGER